VGATSASLSAEVTDSSCAVISYIVPLLAGFLKPLTFQS
jgi:hypothetical protein